MSTRSFAFSTILCALVVFAAPASSSSEGQDSPSPDSTFQLIPTPQKLVFGKGTFVFSSATKIVLAHSKDKEDLFAAEQLMDEIQMEFHLRPTFSRTISGKTIFIGLPAASKLLQGAMKRARVMLPPELGDEGYLLHVSSAEIIIAARTHTGLFYGVQTLKQLIRSHRTSNAIPCLTISDWPAVRYRGWMADISRGPIPTMTYLKHVIRTMAEYKQNFFTLYTEHVFHLKSHPEIAPADGITAEEIADLTAFARQYHIELIGNAQSFGHMEHMLSSPFYNNIRENASVLVPGIPETYRFLKDEYDEIVPAYTSSMFHINCDEVYGLGSGPGKRMVDSLGMPAVYAYHINRINDLLKPYGKRILMWGDIAAQNPEIIPQLPKDMVIISWGYDAAESFEGAILPFKKTGYDFMVAPGVSCWNEVWPNMTTAVINISNYVRDGAHLGTLGVMNTAWDDDGENFFSYNWHGLLWGAECSWHPARPLTGSSAQVDRDSRLAQFNQSFDKLFYGMSGVSGTLFLFDSLRHIPVNGIVRDNGVWSSMLNQSATDTSTDAVVQNDRVVTEAKSLIGKLNILKAQVVRNSETLDFALFAAKRVLFTGRKNLVRISLAHAMSTGDPDEIASVKAALTWLLDELHALKAEYALLWQRENRSWWLNRILSKYDRLGTELLSLDKAVMIEPADSIADGKRSITLRTPFNDQPIYYSTDGSEPTTRSSLYAGSFSIDRSSVVRARVIINDQLYPMTESFFLLHKAIGRLYKLNSPYSRYNRAYAAGGPMGLLDGLRGSENFADGRWQGYHGRDLDIVIDLQKPIEVKSISVGFLQNSFSWILMPERVQIFVSGDSANFVLAKEIPNTVDPREEETILKDFRADFSKLVTRYIRIVAKNPGKLPVWHHAAGNNSYIFADEIVVE